MFFNKSQVPFKRIVLFAIAFLLCYLIFLLVFRDYKSITSMFSVFLIPFVTSITFIILLKTYYRSRGYGKSYQRVWLFLMLSQLFWVVGDIFWGIYATYPWKLMDNTIIYIPYAIRTTLLCIGIILIPKPHIERLNWLKNNTEIAIVLVSLTMILWSFLIYPFLTINSIAASNTGILIFYTLIHFALLFSTISILIYYIGHLKDSPVSFIILSATLQIIAALIFAYETLLNQFPGGGFEDMFWVMASVSMALAGLLQMRKTPPKVIKDLSKQFKFLKTTSNYSFASIMVIIAYIIVVWSFFNDKSIFTIFILGGGVIVGLAIIRQALANQIIKNYYEKMDRSEKEFRSVVETAKDGIITTDDDGKIIFWNRYAEKILGYSNPEYLNMKLDSIIPELNRVNLESKEKEAAYFESYGIKKDGNQIPLEITSSSWELDQNKFFTCIIHDITSRKIAEDQLKDSIKEKEILLKEIHHRVKNNMQIISSLLNMQIGITEGDEAINVLKTSQGRIKSMAMIHEKLYQSPNLDAINFKEYIEKLTMDLIYIYADRKSNIGRVLDIEEINFNIDTAIPCGLIINELVTNSIKYAFPEGNGNIFIKLKSIDDNIELNVADD